MRYPIRHILPSAWIATALGAAYLAMELIASTLGEDNFVNVTEFHRGQVVVVVVAALLYGVSRAITFHPVCNRDYAQWLQTTPWTPSKPLLLGPIHLIWVDAVGLGVLEFATIRLDTSYWPVPLVAFLTAYLVPMAILLLCTGARLYGCGLLLVLPLGLLTKHWEWAFGIQVAAYAIAYLGVQRSLQSFPWSPTIHSRLRASTSQPPANPDEMKERLGWPYSRLQPFAIKPEIKTGTAAAISLLVAWYLYVIRVGFAPGEPDFPEVAYIAVLAGAPTVRLVIYLGGIRPPISLLGRLASGRLILPGFDRVFVAPLSTVACGLVALALRVCFEASLDLVLPLAVGSMIWVATTWGPTLAEWRLTGNHRLSPGLGPGAMYTQL